MMTMPVRRPAPGRVRLARLRAADQSLVRRGAVLLEDALATAASGLGRPGRLTVVRSLAVGRIAPDRAPAHLSARLESRLRALADGARRWSDPGAAGAEAVYFEDELAPYLGLATCLAEGGDAGSWFWLLALPGWRPGLALGPSLRGLLFEVVGATRAGPVGAVELVRALQERGRAETLLAELGPPDGPALLAMFGWTEAAPLPRPAQGESPEPLPPPSWAPQLVRWIAQWGWRDPRSTWLSAVSLLAERPTRLIDPTLRPRAERLAQVSAQPLSKARRRSPDRPAVQESGPATGPPADPLPAAPEWGGADGPENGRQPEGLDQTPDDPGQLKVQPARAEGGGRPARTLARGVEGADSGEQRAPGVMAVRLAGPGLVSAGQSDPLTALAAPDTPAPAADSVAGAVVAPPPERPRPHASPTVAAQPLPAGRSPTAADQPVFSPHAGLFLLLPALERLGLAELLTTCPGLIELDLPARLLAEVARRVGVPDDDPAVRLLALPTEPPPGCYPYSLPPRLAALASPGRWVVRREAGPGGARALADRSERLTLALWRGRRPAALRLLAASYQTGPGSPLPANPDLTLLLDSWYTALRRWGRRGPGLGLAEIVRRPGRLLATRTHLDLFLDPAQAEARIRRAGLDLDPGWIAWFGRVVLFHYQESR
jgi:hypothetical protein